MARTKKITAQDRAKLSALIGAAGSMVESGIAVAFCHPDKPGEWEFTCCGGKRTRIKTAKQAAAAFNKQANPKTAYVVWDFHVVGEKNTGRRRYLVVKGRKTNLAPITSFWLYSGQRDRWSSFDTIGGAFVEALRRECILPPSEMEGK